MHTRHSHGDYCTWRQRWYDDVIKWKHFPRYWPFVGGIHRWPVNSPHKGQWRGALIFSFICVWINDWVNNREAGDLRRHRGHYGVTVMDKSSTYTVLTIKLLRCFSKFLFLWCCWFKSISLIKLYFSDKMDQSHGTSRVTCMSHHPHEMETPDWLLSYDGLINYLVSSVN